VPGIGQQDAAQIDGGRRGIDWPVKALLDQSRNPAAVIDVGVGQDDGIDLTGREGQVFPITLAPFLLPLEETAIHQHLDATAAAFVAGIDQVLGAGHDAGCAEKLDVAQLVLIMYVFLICGFIVMNCGLFFNSLRRVYVRSH